MQQNKAGENIYAHLLCIFAYNNAQNYLIKNLSLIINIFDRKTYHLRYSYELFKDKYHHKDYIDIMPNSYKYWHIPISDNTISLTAARDSLAQISASDVSIPLIIRLVENPQFKLPFITLFHGAVTMEQHDAIHFVLGRGLLSKDEAFVIGMTMGSTQKMHPYEAEAFCFIARYLYPKPYNFSRQDCAVFKQAVRLAQKMQCKPLDTFPFEKHQDKPLSLIREMLEIDTKLLIKAYRQEQETYPHDPASTRLLHPLSQACLAT